MNKPLMLVDEKVILQQLKEKVKQAGTQAKLAKQLEISAQRLNNTLNGRTILGPKLAKKLGYRRVAGWVKDDGQGATILFDNDEKQINPISLNGKKYFTEEDLRIILKQETEKFARGQTGFSEKTGVHRRSINGVIKGREQITPAVYLALGYRLERLFSKTKDG